ncbi:MAG TPA: lipopolysaccharide kinase InaA family protein [Thermoanaerobaculaceae bacterium]|nr:lipopolysaccharide kinase InaA family protein [Thermoanaerobaculaceae bacterium]
MAAVVTIVRLAPAWNRPETRDWCEGLEALAATVTPDAEIYRGRNVIFRATAAGRQVAVKRFPVSSLGRRLIYRVRATKAARAFDHAVRLGRLGVGTPEPLAAVEVRRRGLPTAAYFCTAFLPEFREARALRLPDAADRSRLLALTGAFVGRLHELGVLHLDLTAGNVLIVPAPGRPAGLEFQLVDINRMRFGPVGTATGIANLVQLRLNDDGELLAGYCGARGLDAARLRRLYERRLALRALTQSIKERTRPWRRRLGL